MMNKTVQGMYNTSFCTVFFISVWLKKLRIDNVVFKYYSTQSYRFGQN